MATPRHAQPPAAPTAAPSPTPATYVPLPRRLLEDLRDAPAAIGVFALLGRLFLVAGGPVPLSSADLQAYDPTLSYGAARRALDRLLHAGYALAEGAGGRKLAYQPTWGRVHAAPLPWANHGPGLGRPRHVRAVRLDDRLLDLCLGRLRPHHAHRAVVERYLARPLLGLREVGLYALALAGLPAASPALAALGLLDAAGQTLPLPDDRTVLAVASQRAAEALTPAGWRHAGLAPAPAASAPGEAVFFVPPDMIGSMIGPVIGGVIAHPIAPPTVDEPPTTASECGNAPREPMPAGSHGSTESYREDRATTTLNSHGCPGGGGVYIGDTRAPHPPAIQASTAETFRNGGCVRQSSPGEATRAGHTPGAGHCSTSAAETSSVSLLRGFGVRADVAIALAGRPAAQVAHVIAQARARPGVRDPAAWVVSALRALPENAPPPAPADERPPSASPIYFHPGLSAEERARWLMRFRAAPSPHEQRAILARLEQEHPR